MSKTEPDHSLLRASIEQAAQTLAAVEDHIETIGRIALLLAHALRHGNKLLACGNGGSAADAQHLTGEWVGRFVQDRRSYPAIALTADGPLLTGIANDYGYEQAFARQVGGLGAPGDVLIAFSTSGNSESVHGALTTAKEAGLGTVAVLGRDGGRTRGIADHEIIIASDVTARIQEAHALVIHLICEETERLLAPPAATDQA